jgi:hypothetical protein
MSAVKVKGSKLEPGDVLATGGVVVGYICLVKGGTKYRVRQANGVEIDAVFDGRRSYAVERAS